MNFDKFLVLHIFTYCSYQDIIRWTRINKFFHNSISNSTFWQLYRERRSNPVSYNIEYRSHNDLNTHKIVKYDNLEDIYDVMGHFILKNIDTIETIEYRSQGDYNILIQSKDRSQGDYHFLYQSSKFVWWWHKSNIEQSNWYWEQNDGLGEGDYDEETGLPNYYEHMQPEPEFDDSYKSIATTRLYRFFKKEDTAFIDPNELSEDYRMNYECKVIERRSVVGALPDYIIGKILTYATNNNVYNEMYRVSKKFNRIFLTYVCPPWANNSKGLLHACRENYKEYFTKWKYFAGNRLDNQEAFRIAFIHKSDHIINSLDSIFFSSLSLGNLKLICSDLSLIQKIFIYIDRYDIPEMIKEALRIGNKEVVRFLRNGYNSKLGERKHRYLL